MTSDDVWYAVKAFLAFPIAVVRRRKPFYLGGLYWAFCGHRSHRYGLRCWRWFCYDGYCSKHNVTCYGGCPPHAS